jgi:hypothetical protein
MLMRHVHAPPCPCSLALQATFSAVYVEDSRVFATLSRTLAVIAERTVHGVPLHRKS